MNDGRRQTHEVWGFPRRLYHVEYRDTDYRFGPLQVAIMEYLGLNGVTAHPVFHKDMMGEGKRDVTKTTSFSRAIRKLMLYGLVSYRVEIVIHEKKTRRWKMYSLTKKGAEILELLWKLYPKQLDEDV